MKSPELKAKDSLYQEVEKKIEQIKKKKNIYVRTYRSVKLLVFIAGAAITILTGWKKTQGCEFDPGNWILVISATITLFAAFEGLFDLKDKAMSYDILLFELRKLRDKMCFDFHKVNKDLNLFEIKKDKYFTKFEDILQSQKSIIANSYESEQ